MSARIVLDGIKVIELAEGVAGPLAAQRLVCLGASIIKVERQHGDWLRGAAPTSSGSDMSAAFFEFNRGKRSLALGREPGKSGEILNRLLKTADIVISDLSDVELDKLGIRAALREDWTDNPKLIVADISPWGREGPFAGNQGSELAAQAFAGYTRYLGKRGAPARRLGADVAQIGTATFLVQAVLAALYRRAQSGKGQRVSLSLLNSLLSLKSIQLAAQSDPDQYEGPRVGGANDPPEQGWKTEDRPIFFAFGGSVGAEGRPGWQQFVEEFGMGRLAKDARFDRTGRDSTGFGSAVHALRGEYEKEFAAHASNDLVSGIQKFQGIAAAYSRVDETLAHPQTEALGIVTTVKDESGEGRQVRRFPARFSDLELTNHGAAPGLGQHTGEILADLGFKESEIADLIKSGALLGEGAS